MKFLILFFAFVVAVYADLPPPGQLPPGLIEESCPNFPFCGPSPPEDLEIKRVPSSDAVSALTLEGYISQGSKGAPTTGQGTPYDPSQGPPPNVPRPAPVDEIEAPRTSDIPNPGGLTTGFYRGRQQGGGY